MNQSAAGAALLAIDGPIGVGKTTLAHLLHQTVHANLMLEQFEDNAFLPLFYTDRQRYALQTQLAFLLDRFNQWTDLPHAQRLLVSDYLFDKDRLFAELNLVGTDLARYLKVFRTLRKEVRQPDGVIYLHADVDVLLTRIGQRGRPYEQQMERAYLSQLCQAYTRFFATYAEAPLIALDTTSLDLVRRAEDRAAVMQHLQAFFPFLTG